MNKAQYIHDDFGNEIPLLDDSGNLSLQVIMLYTEDKLTGADRKIVDDYASTDEFTKDALEGYALTSNASKTRFAIGELNSSIQKRSGAKAISTLAPQKQTDFDYRKLAAAIALLIVVGGGTFFVTQYLKDDNLALNKETDKAEPSHKTTPPTKVFETVPMSVDSINESSETETDNSEEISQAFATGKAENETRAAAQNQNEKDRNIEEPNEEAPPTAKSQTVTEIAVEPVEEIDQSTISMEDEVELAEDNSNESEEATDKFEIAEPLSGETQILREQERNASLAQEAKAKRAETSSYQTENAAMADRGAADLSEKKSAKFPGGDIKMYQFIERKKNYTEPMRIQGLQGAVTVTFDIEDDGRITNARIKSGVAGLLDQDALRIVRSMPKWKPAVENGQTVKSSRSIVVKYGD